MLTNLLASRTTPEVESRMNDFYSNYVGYTAYHQESSAPDFWALIREVVPPSIERKLSVLELGAGKTGAYTSFCLENGYILHAHDINGRNHSHYSAKGVCIAEPISESSGKYDIIFSSYVFEHVSRPEDFIRDAMSALKPGGSLFILCPNYDSFARNPSFDNLNAVNRWLLRLYLFVYSRIASAVLKPHFILNKNPAIFNMEWSADRDALHVVSKSLLLAWCKSEKIAAKSYSLKDSSSVSNLKYNMATCCVQLIK